MSSEQYAVNKQIRTTPQQQESLVHSVRLFSVKYEREKLGTSLRTIRGSAKPGDIPADWRRALNAQSTKKRHTRYGREDEV